VKYLSSEGKYANNLEEITFSLNFVLSYPPRDNWTTKRGTFSGLNLERQVPKTIFGLRCQGGRIISVEERGAKMRNWHIRLTSILGLVLILFLLPTMPFAQEPQDKVIATKSIIASYVGAEIGDYNHAIFRTSDGKEVDFWCSGEMVEFLNKYKGKKIDITYQITDTYIPEARGVQRIEVIKDAKVDNQSFSTWKKKKP